MGRGHQPSAHAIVQDTTNTEILKLLQQMRIDMGQLQNRVNNNDRKYESLKYSDSRGQNRSGHPSPHNSHRSPLKLTPQGNVVTCHHCHKPGHYKADCYTWKRQVASNAGPRGNQQLGTAAGNGKR